MPQKARRDADGNRLLTQEEWAAGLYRGQSVIGRVIESNVNGSVIEILKRLRPPETPSAFDYGWMPSQERPVNLRDADRPSKFSVRNVFRDSGGEKGRPGSCKIDGIYLYFDSHPLN